jgi:penicillin-binding protein 1A
MGFKHPAGGKTGTTNDFKDAWFNGFTKDFSVSVWVGRDNNSSMIDKRKRGFTGGGAAAPIWVYFLQKVLDSKNEVKFPVPPGIKLATVDIRTGLIPEEGVTEVLQVAVKEEVELMPATQVDDISVTPESDSLLTIEELNAIPIP